ncbi:hypothetical protein [Parasitella parasitica]|uniref:Uncharacterized protein n=1 Tax=Parasitella parasitica TaxID=35722 RepID=A0A0B7MTL7_9FUNG|nr:hypothetical protein [Parasitella parasitica]
MNVPEETKKTADLYAKATDAFIDDDYDEALTLFTELVALEPENPEFLLKRCQVHQKLNHLECALQDGEKALGLLEQGSRSLLARAHLQLGITLHRLNRFTEAQNHLEQSKELNPNEKTLVTWLRKNTEKLPKVEEKPEAALPAAPAPAAAKTVARREWFQNDTFVTIQVYLKQVKSELVDLNFFNDSLSLSVKLPNGSNYSLELDPLAHYIIPEESTHSISSTKIEIKLKKAMVGIMWGALESDNDQGTTTLHQVAPTSTATKPTKDWNKLTAEVDKEEPEGEQALNALFQNIYKNADPDTQRAMMKSFVESNGTCLSTNWEEIKQKKTEIKPPEGMTVLIANRGEIACRVIRTCRRLGIFTVAVYSDSDENAPFVKMADEAYHIGPSIASESYLNGAKLIAVAKRSGADALHPGYGFLSENADFADEVIKAGINFIGPLPNNIRAIGDKIAAKLFITENAPSIPLIPGYNGTDQSIDRLEMEAKKIEFPVLLKASAGGGGKGMRAVYETSKLKEEIEAAQGESLRAFGSDQLLIEKYFESIRHVEIQIFGDKYGNVYHINERDCSVQRRHQKVVEETPSPALDAELRAAMTSAAVELGRKLGYVGAGTAEFILDEHTKKFYFLELNTRLQVEHPITEAISGLDLVELQLLVAQGANLKELGVLDNIEYNGHAIEVRLCAEDPDNDFGPRTGVIHKWSPADAAKYIPGVRFDTGVEDGSQISIFYDSMVAKVIVHAPTRAEAVRRMGAVLARTVIVGVTTNQKFLISVMKNPCFQSGTFDTNFIQQEKERLFPAPHINNVKNSIIAAFLFDWTVRRSQQVHLRNIQAGWRNVKWRNKRIDFAVNHGRELQIQYDYLGQPDNDKRHVFKAQVLDKEHAKQGEDVDDLPIEILLFENDLGKQVAGPRGIQGCKGLLRCTIDGAQLHFYIAEDVKDVNEKSVFVHDFVRGHQVELVKLDRLKSKSATAEDDRVTPYTSSMPCRVLKVLAPSGTIVKKNTPLLSIESMKTEVKILSRHDGVVTMRVEENQLVDARVLLCSVDNANK